MKLKDPLVLFNGATALVVSNSMAETVGPYLLIVVAATAGAWVALGRREPEAKPNGLPFLLIVNVIAILFTSLFSVLISSNFSSLEERLIFGPVAFIIGWIGLDWPTVIPKALELYTNWRTVRTGGKDASQ